MFSKKLPCPKCKSKVSESYDFCPHCGQNMSNPEKDMEQYGLLGKNEASMPVANLGFTDKIVSSIFNNLLKSLDSQMKQHGSEQHFPNGIQIRLGMPQPNKKPAVSKRKAVTEEQVARMSKLPRAEAKTDVRRLSDRVIYELQAHGLNSVDDVFVSKVESGYEIKAIGKSKVYVNSLQIDLPLKSYAVTDKGLVVEFGLQ